jgi:hypothetical protein
MVEDERSIANRLANEEKKSADDEGRTSTKGAKTKEQRLGEDDPTAPVYSTLNCLEGDSSTLTAVRCIHESRFNSSLLVPSLNHPLTCVAKHQFC